MEKPDTLISWTPPVLPLQDRPERLHLYKWMAEEEEYVAGKFDDQRDGHDATLENYDLDAFWTRQIVQYYDRARQFLIGASQCEPGSTVQRDFELRAQQAMVKAMMTAKGLCESSIRVYGALPKPGVSSGTIEKWERDD